MRIVYVITRADDIGGAQVHVRDLSGALLARGHEVTVLAGREGEFFEQLDARRIPRRSARRLAAPLEPTRDFAAFCEILAALRELRPDIVAAHTAKAGLLGRVAATVLRIPAVFTPHGWSISDRISLRQGRIFRCAESIGARLSSRIINVCDFEAQLAIRHRIASVRKLTRIYNGIPDVSPSLLASVTRQPPHIIMVARFAEPKQHLILLKALAELKQLAWSLEFIGEGPLEQEIRCQAAQLGIANRILLSGFCRDVAEKLSKAQIVALISRFEAFPYSILEAMRAGIPVVASDIGGIPESVVDSQTGLLVPLGNDDALCAALASLIVNPALRKRLGDAGRRRYLQHFTLEEMVARTIQVYTDVVAERAAPSNDVAFKQKTRLSRDSYGPVHEPGRK